MDSNIVFYFYFVFVSCICTLYLLYLLLYLLVTFVNVKVKRIKKRVKVKNLQTQNNFVCLFPYQTSARPCEGISSSPMWSSAPLHVQLISLLPPIAGSKVFIRGPTCLLSTQAPCLDYKKTLLPSEKGAANFREK